MTPEIPHMNDFQLARLGDERAIAKIALYKNWKASQLPVPFKNLQSFILNTDWELLREQKIRLFELVRDEILKPEQVSAIEGILSLLDYLQDAVVADKLVDEGGTVFSNLKDQS